MRGMISWFAKNSVAANLLMVAIVAGGIVSSLMIRMEIFPEFSLGVITVTVSHPGAAPEEIEEGICVRIEEQVHSIEGIKKLTSTASEGVGTVTIEVLPGEDPRRVLDDVKVRVDSIDTFPEEAEKPIIQEALMRRQVINLAVTGKAEEALLKQVAERVRDDLTSTDGISQVQLKSARPYEVSVEISEESLRRHGLTFDDLSQAVRNSSLDLSGGSIKTSGGEVLLRTKAQAYLGTDFEELVLMAREDGTRLLLRDVATVVDGFQDTDQSARFNGEPCILVQVYRVGDESALGVSALVKEYVESIRPELPEGLTVETWGDTANWLQSRLDLLIRNGKQGLLLVFAVLALFLRFRLSVWITIGIPISFLGAMTLLPPLDVSINMLSLFAFILVLGIVVDDAIVVGESVLKEQEKGHKGVEGAIRGAEAVSVPVTFAVLTSVVAFTPMLNMPGILGKFFKVIPLVVIPCLIFSWVESKLILPSHLAHETRLTRFLGSVAPFKWWVGIQQVISRGLDRFINGVYRPVLELALRYRYVTLAISISLLILMGGLVQGGFVKFKFFSRVEGDIVSAQLSLPLGTSASETEKAVTRIEQAARQLAGEFKNADGTEVVKCFVSAIGEQPYRDQQSNKGVVGTGAFSGAHLGEVTMELLGAEEREVRSGEIVKRWRELTGEIPGAVELIFGADIMSAGDAINVQFAGRNIDELRAAAGELEQDLVQYGGVFDVANSWRGGKQELRLELLPAAESLGLTQMDLARQVRQGFYGEEAQRIQRGRDDVKVMVRYPNLARNSLAGLENMRVRTPQGAEVPFHSVAKATYSQGFATISRAERERTVRVTADVDETAANANEILAVLENSVLPRILDSYPSVKYSFEGENREQKETKESMIVSMLLALLVIYGLMAIPFRSYFQPLIVMAVIPFGLVGAIIGHVIFGLEISMLSMCGIVALAGVVVNDSLVLVDRVNRRRAEGRSIGESARLAGADRFRPILLTSLTTFAGLTPLIMEKSVQAQFLIPMAISLAYGVMFATLITLILVPAGYLILEDQLNALRWIFLGPKRGNEKVAVAETATK